MKKINYLLGYPDLYIVQDDDYFKFSLDSVLLPNFVTLNKKITKILDIGCGNAPIPLILSTRTNASIIGVELQTKIYDLAKETIKLNNLDNQISIINQDIKDYYLKEETDTYDVITCNPPYFEVNNKSIFNKNIELSTARHEKTLDLETVMKISKKLLKNNGKLAIVNRPERLLDILILMRNYNIEPKRIMFVYPKSDTPANILLVEGAKNGKKGIKIEQPLYVYENGNYTKEILKYLERK
ncbi:MAG: tRNA1(Val) (adenine(37)-N6)-methyltransferase [Bacilli bacterium]|nr:tRNA1(Val) (adenine(37)-N6)-methyltransferase [Bacilli bacterium]